MRSLFIPAIALTAAFAAPALAQQATTTQQPVAPQPNTVAAGQPGAMRMLTDARQRLQTAAQQLRQAGQGGDQQAIARAQTEAREAADAVRQAMGGLSPEQRAQVQEQLRQAEAGLQVGNHAASADALDRVVAIVVVAPVAAAMPDPLAALSVQELMDEELYGANGENIGDVEDVVLIRDGRRVALVVGVGGFLGIGERQVAIPLSDVRMGEGGRLTTGLTRDQISAIQLYDRAGHEPLDRSLRVGDAG